MKPMLKGGITNILVAFVKSPLYFMNFFWGIDSGIDTPIYSNMFPEIWKWVAYRLQHTKKLFRVILASRGWGKTKILTGYDIWSLFVNRRSYLAIFTHDAEKSKQILRDVIGMISTKKFKSVFPWRKGEVFSKSKGIISFYTQDGSLKIVEAKGTGQSLLGASEWNLRPDIFHLDDLTADEEQASSIERVNKLVDWFLLQLFYARKLQDKDGRDAEFNIIDTPKSDQDFISRAKRFDRDLTTILVVPALAEKIEERNFGIPEGRSTWEEQCSTATLLKERAFLRGQGKEYVFLRNRQMKSVKDREKVVFDPVRVLEIDEASALDACKQYNAPIRITVDMAYTTSTHSDFVGIVVAAELPQSILFLESLKIKESPNDLYNILCDLRDKYLPYNFEGVWAETLQYSIVCFAFDAMNMLTKKNLIISTVKEVAQLNAPNRIQWLVPFFNCGWVKFVEGKNDDLIRELLDWDGEKGKKKFDVADAASYHVKLRSPIVGIEEKGGEVKKHQLTAGDVIREIFAEESKEKEEISGAGEYGMGLFVPDDYDYVMTGTYGGWL